MSYGRNVVYTLGVLQQKGRKMPLITSCDCGAEIEFEPHEEGGSATCTCGRNVVLKPSGGRPRSFRSQLPALIGVIAGMAAWALISLFIRRLGEGVPRAPSPVLAPIVVASPPAPEAGTSRSSDASSPPPAPQPAASAPATAPAFIPHEIGSITHTEGDWELLGLKRAEVTVSVDDRLKSLDVEASTIKTQVELKLQQAGIKLSTVTDIDNKNDLETFADVDVYIGCLDFSGSKSVVYSVDVSSSRVMILGMDVRHKGFSEVWSHGRYGICPQADAKDEIEKCSGKVGDDFLNDWMKENPK